MKPLRSALFLPRNSRLAASVFASGLAACPAFAATIDKEDNTNDLNLNTSWTGGSVPSAADIANWNGLTGANSVQLGGNLGFEGITIGSTGGAVTIQNGNTLTLGSSGIDMSAADQNLTISSNLTLAQGAQTWNVASGRTLALDTGTFSRSAGSTLNLQGTGTVSASMTGLTNVNNILGPWATVGSGSSTRYATLTGGNVGEFTSGTSATFAWTSSNNNTFNYDVTGPGGTGNVLGLNRVANTARYTGAAGTQFWGSNNTTTITLNGLMNAGSGTLTFAESGGSNQGQLAIGTTNNNELVLHAANAAISINIPIINTGANAGSIVVSGPNTVTFSGVGGANTYTGGTTVASGTLTLVSGATPGASGSTLHIASGAQVFNSGGSVVSNTVTGSGSFTSTSTTSVEGNWSGFTGTYTHNTTTASSTFNTATATSANADYVIASTQGSSQGMIAAGNGDYTLQMGSLSGVANSLFRGGNFATGTTTLEIGSLNTDTTFAGVIANGTDKTMALTKVGSGALTLSGSNTYSGGTVVNAGTLVVNNTSGSATGTGTVTIASGARLEGSGIISGHTTVNGTHAPGNSPGIKTFEAGVSYGATSVFAWELIGNKTDDRGTSWDAVNLTGGIMTVDAGATFQIIVNSTGSDVDFTNAFWNQIQTWEVFSTSGAATIDSTFQNFSVTYGGGNNYSADLGTFSMTSGTLTWTPIPEPSTALAGLLLAAGLMHRRRSQGRGPAHK